MKADPPSPAPEANDGEILAGAAQLLQLIEAVTLFATRRMRLMLRKTLGQMQVELEEFDVARMTALFADPSVRVNIHDIESSVAHFTQHLPDQPQLKAALAHAIAGKYSFAYKDVPQLRRALDLDGEAVGASYRRLFGAPLSSLFATESEPDNRPFWYQLPGSMMQEMLADLVQETTWRYLPSGQTLFEQGDEGDSVYSIVSGRLRIIGTNELGEETVTIEKGRGEIVGEIAMLAENSRRTAAAYAIRDTELVELDRAGFERLVVKYPLFGLKVTKLITNAFRDAVSGLQRPHALTSLAIMPAHRDIPLARFVDGLETELGRYGSVFVLTGERFDQLLGQGASQVGETDERNGALLVWLTDLELAHRFVVYVTDHEPSEWTRRCLRMADRTILVANGSDRPEAYPIERLVGDRAAGFRPGRELVLLQPSQDQRPAGTGAWFEARQVNRHHHVQLDSRADLARLARFFAGQAVGLALSGGGARGLAHVGVIRALQENDIPIDLVGGTSFGAIVGAFLSLGMDWRQINEALQEAIANRNKHFKLAFPHVSLMEGHRLSQVFQHYYGGINIEDLWRPFFCVASNLTQARLEILERGPLWRAVRASVSLPTVFPPVLHGADMLVDGGVMNDLPSDIVKSKIEGGLVLASNASSFKAQAYRYENDSSSWQLLLARLRPSVKDPIPSIITVAADTMGLASKWRRARQYASADLVFEVPVEHYDNFDYEAAEALIEAGYQTAQQALDLEENRERLSLP